MTRAQLVKEICRRLDLQGLNNKQLVKHILEQEEDIVYECIATEDSITYIWGKIYGTSRWPKRVGGAFSEKESVIRNNGWCTCKRGVAKVKWSKATEICDEQDAQEFFEEEGHKYTTLARIFRMDNNIPEIPEYEGLDEEEINYKCKMADQIELDTYLPQYKVTETKHNREINRVQKLALIQYYKKTNHKPMGMLYDKELGDENWTDEQRTLYGDILDKLTIIVDEGDKFDYLTKIVCAYIGRGQYSQVNKLYDVHKETYDKLIADGKTPEFNLYFIRKSRKTPKYLGEENPWGLDDTEKIERERFTFFTEYFAKFGIKPVYINGKLVPKGLDYDYDWENDENFIVNVIKPKAPKRRRNPEIGYV